MIFLNKFKDSLSIQFYDITEDMIYNTNENWKFVPINNKEAKIILDFILKHKNDNFLIHCEKRSIKISWLLDQLLNVS